MMTAGLFDEVVKAIHNIPEDGLKKSLIRSLEQSVKLDAGNDPPQPKSPRQLSERYGIDIDVLHQYQIVLTKDDAIEFLKSLGLKVREPKFKRKYTASTYSNYFDRPVSKKGERALVFTYAEILHWFGLKTDLTIPNHT